MNFAVVSSPLLATSSSVWPLNGAVDDGAREDGLLVSTGAVLAVALDAGDEEAPGEAAVP